MVMASCSNETVFEEGPAGAQQTSSIKGDMYMTMAILPASNAGTRTATPDQGVEVGKDRENKVTSAQIILAKKTGTEEGKNALYTIFKSWNVGSTSISGQNPYTATFEVSREDLLNDIKNNGTFMNGSDGPKKLTYYVFVVANPTSNMVQNSFAEGTDIQKTFELEADANTYWTDNQFLMSSDDAVPVTIDDSDSQETGVALGTHTTSASALNLGTVGIQRAMSRFDIETDEDYTEFTAQSDKSTLKDITITFDAAALVNQATAANLFKVTTESADALGSMTTSFVKRANNTATQWVKTPDQLAFTLPLFGTNYPAKGATDNATKGDGDLFDNGIKLLSGTQFAFSGLNYDSYSSFDEVDNRFTHPNDATPSYEGNYKIWRYCMENTNQYNPENQLNGNSTGIVFRAIMTSSTLPTVYDDTDTEKKGKAIYAYGNMFIGDAKTLGTYYANPKAEDNDDGNYEVARNKYIAALAKYNDAQGEDNTENNKKKLTLEEDKTGTGDWSAPAGSELAKGYTDVRKATAEKLAELDTYLVDEDFSIYRPTNVENKPVYYCYYLYWNRHNDNGQNTQMGIMEFATVRNNVYKLRVTKINKLGHPGEPGDDPDTPDPDDPDEKDHLYLQVEVKVLPWEVRMNDIEF